MKNDFCKHYQRGCLMDRGPCAKGIIPREVTGGDDFGWAVRMPCNGKEKEDSVSCDLYEKYTDEEKAQREADLAKEMKEMMEILPLIQQVKDRNKDGGSEELECPRCSKKLFVSISDYNGHAHAHCETENCVNMME